MTVVSSFVPVGSAMIAVIARARDPRTGDGRVEGEPANDLKKRLRKPAEERVGCKSGASGNEPGLRDDYPRDRADGQHPLRPPEFHPRVLQRGSRWQDLRVRGLRAGWRGESR